MFNLEGRKVFITGATGGIGEAIARLFHQRGAIIGIHGTRVEKLQKLKTDLKERVFIFDADLKQRELVKQLGQKVEEEMQGIDILVNNAGITRDGLFVRMSDQDWDEVLAVDLSAVFTLSKELVYPMMRRRFGRIINITSIVGVTGNPGQVNYCAAKAGMIGFSKSLAQEIASRNVTVNCIAPGFIQSDMTDKLNDKQKETIMASIPLKRMGTSKEIANAAVFLASEEASYITGQTLHVNGGMAMI